MYKIMQLLKDVIKCTIPGVPDRVSTGIPGVRCSVDSRIFPEVNKIYASYQF